MVKNVVLDTTVIIKALLMPSTKLPPNVYAREQETHRKCRSILEILDEVPVGVVIPAVCIVETASALSRLTKNEELARTASLKLEKIYRVVGEDVIFHQAWKIALETGASGFDSYFIALASLLDALLITDDASMADKARSLGLRVLLVREI